MSDNRPDVDLIFSAALELTSPEARAAYLQNACGPDLALRHRVERLLQAHASAGSFLGAPAAVDGNATIDAPGGGEGSLAERTLNEGPGTTIGPYRLLERIGEGGMGTVFMAEQTHPVRRKVALKIIKLGMDTRQVVARFEAERQALALMDHPNIAKVLDAGATEAGRPYFVMELVKGMPITEYCDQSHLATRQRLELFVQVCNAVQHAHQKGIIHRDLKPTNVLVTLHDDRPVPKVIDFGIAKATAQQLTEKTLFTNFGQMLGTPLYMSPEQAQLSGLDADTRSDVYSLGVLLYELLTGTTPFDRQRLGRAAYDEIRRIIREEEPPRPSTRLSTLGSDLTTVSAHRGTSAKKLGQLVRGELDWIVMRAMEKDRTRRYDTANGLARDVERYLHDEPVSACPPSTAYRFRKFARRYRAPLSAAAVVAVALVAGVVVSSWQAVRATRAERFAQRHLEAETAAHQEAEAARDRAEKDRDRAVKAEQRAAGNFTKARSAITDYLAKVSESELLKVPGLQPLRRELLTAALGFYQELLKEQADNPGLQAELADAYLRAGKIYSELGSKGESAVAVRSARSGFESLLKGDPTNPTFNAGLAECLAWQGYNVEAAAIWQKLVQAEPGNARFQRELSESYNALAVEYYDAGNFSRAMDFHQKALVIREALVLQTPDDPDARNLLGMTLNNIGVLLNVQDQNEQALAMYRQGAQHARAAFERAPQVVLFGRMLANGYSNMSLREHGLGRLAAALATQQQAVEIRKRLATENPALPYVQAELYQAYWALASRHRALEQPELAAEAVRQARETIAKLPTVTADDYYTLARVHARCSELSGQDDQELTSEQREERRREGDSAVEALRKAIAAGMNNADLLKEDRDLQSLRQREDFKVLAAHLEEIAKAKNLLVRKANTAAERLSTQQEATGILEKLVERDPQGTVHLSDMAAAKHAMGLTYVGMRRFDEAEKMFGEALEVFERVSREEPDNVRYGTQVAMAHLGFGQLHWAAERWPEAAGSWNRAVELLDAAAQRHPSSSEAVDGLRDGHRTILMFYAGAGLWAEAALHAEQAFGELPEPVAGWSFGHASLRLVEGDVAGYQGVRRRMFPRHASSRDGTVLLEVLRTITLGPDPQVPSERLIQIAEEGLKPYPKNSARLGWTGMAYLRAGRYAEALPWFERSYIADRRWPVSYPMLALAHHRLGNDEAAREWLARTDQYLAEICREALGGTSISLSPDWGIYHGCMEAEILRREAATLIDRSPAAANPWLALIRARGHARLAQLEKAEAELKQTEEVKDATLWAARGRILAEMGQHERAEADFDRARQMDPSDPAPWVMRARCRAERGLSEEADAALGRAGELAKHELQPILQAGGWWVVGPFTGNGLTSATSLEAEADPSRPVVGLASDGKPAPELAWRSAPMTNWDQVLLTKEFGAVENASFYALAYVHCSAPRTATFKAVGDDQIRVWVNGQRVHESFQRRSMEEAEHLTVPLQAGRNTILVKVWNHSGSGWFHLRFFDSPYERGYAAHNEGLAPECASEFARWVSQHSLNARPFELMRLAEAARIAGMSSEFDRACSLLRMYVHPEYVEINEAWESARVLSTVEHPLVPVPVLQSLAERGATVKEWYARLPLVIAHYRAGQFQEAIRLAEEIDPDATNSCTYPLRAMAYHRLGQAVDAGAWLGKTDGWHAQTLQDALSKHDGKIVYGDWFHFLILREEAKLLIEGRPPAEDPQHLAQIQRARARWLSDSGPQTLDARIANEPGNAKLLSARGLQYAEQGQWEQAAADYDKVLDITRAARGGEEWVSPWHSACQELSQWDELFERVAVLRPNDLEIWVERGRYCLLRSRWQQAAESYGRVSESLPVGDPLFELACLRLLCGDAEAYRQLCERLLKTAGETTDSRQGFFLARTCAISGGSGIDPTRVLRWGELGARDHNAWGISALGMSHFRAGQYEQAIARLEESNALDWQVAGRAQNEFLLAMAHHQLGNAERARDILALANERARLALPAAAGGPARCLAPDWLGIELLRREAEAMINGRPEVDQDEQLPAPGKTPPSDEPAAAANDSGAFGVGPAELPGVVQAEDFDRGGAGVGYHDLTPVNTGSERKYRNSAVDLDPSKDEGGGYQVGGVWAGEWLAYSVRVEEAGLYDIELRVSSPTGGGKLHLEFGGKDVTGPLEIPRTGDWNQWETITARGIRLSAGEQVMRVVFDSAALPGRDGDGAHVCNLNWFRLSNSR